MSQLRADAAVHDRSGLDYPGWEQRGRDLRDKRERTPFEEGDWLIEGEENYGESASQGEDVLKLPHQSISQRINVARAFPPGIRDLRLSWGAHRVLTKLKRDNPDEALYLLRNAAEKGWTATMVREAMVEANLVQRYKAPKRYTVAQLRELLAGHLQFKATNLFAEQFLTWLAEQEAE